MDCMGARDRLSDYRDGTLPETLAEEVSRHLRECAGCSEVDRSLLELRERLRGLPPVSAPPELLARIREAVAMEGGPASSSAGGPPPGRPVRTVFSRLRFPLEAAAAVLLFASVYWYWPGSRPTTVPAPGTPPAAVEIASSASPPAAPPEPVRVARTSPRPADAPSPRVRAAAPSETREASSIATLPEDTPDPKVRVWSLSDLPAVPVLRASTNFARIAPVSPQDAPAAEPGQEPTPAEVAASSHSAPSAAVSHAERLRPPIPYGREVALDVTQEGRDEAGERVGEAALRLGGAVEGTDRVVPGGTVAVRVLLPERTAPAFLEELARIGKIPPDGMPSRSVLPAGPAPGTVAYTVRLRAM